MAHRSQRPDRCCPCPPPIAGQRPPSRRRSVGDRRREGPVTGARPRPEAPARRSVRSLSDGTLTRCDIGYT
jgi:hypothetical protein